jgi:hypothetical protein
MSPAGGALPSLRNSQDEFLHSFDAPPGFASVARRDSTTTALQSLLMINGEWTLTRAHALVHVGGSEPPDRDHGGEVLDALAHERGDGVAGRHPELHEPGCDPVQAPSTRR